ncbi:23193_t:CDS:2 [Gigaspora rosea]|nr:23193_t:CDS:2 [Gigaspora rosea]
MDPGKVAQELQGLTEIKEMLIAQLTNNHNEAEDDKISYTFVLLLLLVHREDIAINETLKCIQNKRDSLLWPNIKNTPINKFRTLGYITHTFLTFYLTEHANI